MPFRYINDFEDFNALSINGEERAALIKLSNLSKETNVEYGQAISGDNLSRVFTSEDKSRVDIPNDVITMANLHLMHSHTNVTPFSAKDFRHMCRENVVRISVITGDDSIFSVSIGNGYRPDVNEFDEIVANIRNRVDIELLDHPDFCEWTPEERSYMAIREQAYQIARYFEWNMEGGRA